jgi:hypothetical protein
LRSTSHCEDLADKKTTNRERLSRCGVYLQLRSGVCLELPSCFVVTSWVLVRDSLQKRGLGKKRISASSNRLQSLGSCSHLLLLGDGACQTRARGWVLYQRVDHASTSSLLLLLLKRSGAWFGLKKNNEKKKTGPEARKIYGRCTRVVQCSCQPLRRRQFRQAGWSAFAFES